MSSLLDRILVALGVKKERDLLPPEYLMAKATGGKSQGRAVAKQVFEGKPCDPPDFVAGLQGPALLKTIQGHVKCKFSPHLEQQRIYQMGKRDLQGNLPVEYEGVAGTCSATKAHGGKVADDRGYAQPFRYVDLNHIYAICCNEFERCPFYKKGVSSDVKVSKKRLRVPSQDNKP